MAIKKGGDTIVNRSIKDIEDKGAYIPQKGIAQFCTKCLDVIGYKVYEKGIECFKCGNFITFTVLESRILTDKPDIVNVGKKKFKVGK